jgi:hypothetical protein
MFWGCSVKNGKPFEIKTGSNKVIHLSEACLTPNSGNEKVYLQLQRGDEKYNLCVLQKDKWESYKLDHFLMLATEDNRPYKLALHGANNNTEVHVTGYLENEDDEEENVDGLTEVKEKIVINKEENKSQREKSSNSSNNSSNKTTNVREEVIIEKDVNKNENVKNFKNEEESDLEEDFNDEEDEDLELDDEDEEEIEKLLNSGKKETPHPTKLQKLEDGTKNPVTPNKPNQNQNNKNQNQNKNLNSGNKNQNKNLNSGNKNQNQNSANKNNNQNSASKTNFSNKNFNFNYPNKFQSKNSQK